MTSLSSRSATPTDSTAPSTPPEAQSPLRCIGKHTGHPAEAYLRWRPSFHLQPATGWLNDPCAPGHDPKTGLYHVSFQWNPNGPDWGDISWGSATSFDMINWTVRDEPTLSPETEYDDKGVFTGCFINGRDGSLTYAYTSVSALPIHHTLPHTAGCESLSLARSCDNGKTWQKLAANPVLPSEPEGLHVTGWRDPYVSRWPTMAKTLGMDEDQTLFGIISGGIRNVTPTTFLYAINAGDLTQWQYICPLVDFGLNLRPSRWSGDLGSNWEVTNFLTLRDELDATATREFLVMGTEGCVEEEPTDGLTPLRRPCRGQLWMSGILTKSEKEASPAVNMSYSFGGHLDHGCLYAANSFFDLHAQKPVVWGWIPEDDLCEDLRHMQGWSGMLSMPRELRMQTLRHVVRACSSDLEDISSIEVESEGQGLHTVRTLASEPLQRLACALRKNPGASHYRVGTSRLSSTPKACSLLVDVMKTNHWELRCMINVSTTCRTVGLRMHHTADHSQSTTFSFDPVLETFFINRPAFASLEGAESSKLINSRPETAPHTLFVTRDPASGIEEMEALEIRAWRDNSVLEVFVNGRTAMSTRLYAADETVGMEFFADDEGEEIPTELISADVWDGIGLSA